MTNNREHILEAAAQIFSQKGYHATSMQDIANAVALKKASLYHHITSKQEILLAILDQALDLLTGQIGEAVNGDASAPERLRLAMRAYLRTLASHRQLAAVLLLEYRSLSPPLYQRHVQRRDRFEQLWRGLLEEGVTRGEFRCPDPAQAARALLGMMNWTITWYRPDGPSTPEEIADQYVDLLLNGLLAEA